MHAACLREGLMSCVEWSLELRTAVYILLVIYTNSKVVCFSETHESQDVLFCFFLLLLNKG